MKKIFITTIFILGFFIPHFSYAWTGIQNTDNSTAIPLQGANITAYFFDATSTTNGTLTDFSFYYKSNGFTEPYDSLLTLQDKQSGPTKICTIKAIPDISNTKKYIVASSTNIIPIHPGDCTFSAGEHTYIHQSFTWGSGRLSYIYGSASNIPFAITNFDTGFYGTQTKIMSMSPENGTTTGNNVTFKLKAFISDSDIQNGSKIKIYLHNIDQNVLLLNAFSPSDKELYNNYATTSGIFDYATTTTLGDGNYRLYAKLDQITNWYTPSGCSILGAFTNLTCKEGSTQFTVNQGTFIGNISQNSYKQFGDIFASTTATSTVQGLKTYCNPLSGDISTFFLNGKFDVALCSGELLTPDAGLIYESLGNFKDNVSTHFPLGYVTDFLNILYDNATDTIPMLTATVPNGIPGAGSHLSIGMNGHELDYLWNATTSSFVSPEASSTETFKDVVGFYWNWLLWIATGMYIISRILGSNVLPNVFYSENDN